MSASAVSRLRPGVNELGSERPPEHRLPALALRLRQDGEHAFGQLVLVAPLIPPPFAKPPVFAPQPLQRLLLFWRQVEGPGHRASKHRRRPLPLEINLDEPLALLV